MNQLTDRIAIVTGGAQGLGAAICRRLAEEGADVVVADLKLGQAQEKLVFRVEAAAAPEQAPTLRPGLPVDVRLVEN